MLNFVVALFVILCGTYISKESPGEVCEAKSGGRGTKGVKKVAGDLGKGGRADFLNVVGPQSHNSAKYFGICAKY